MSNVKITAWDSDLVIIPINLNEGMFNVNYSGVRIIHIPTLTCFESVEAMCSFSKNKELAYEAIIKFLMK